MRTTPRRRASSGHRRHRRRLVLVDLVESEAGGQAGQPAVGIASRHQRVAHDPRPPAVTSGLRISTALATLVSDAPGTAEVADIISAALAQRRHLASNIRVDLPCDIYVKKLTDKHPCAQDSAVKAPWEGSRAGS